MEAKELACSTFKKESSSSTDADAGQLTGLSNSNW
jgi:hypothetical protein